jgi:hypothetical protein
MTAGQGMLFELAEIDTAARIKPGVILDVPAGADIAQPGQAYRLTVTSAPYIARTPAGGHRVHVRGTVPRGWAAGAARPPRSARRSWTSPGSPSSRLLSPRQHLIRAASTCCRSPTAGTSSRSAVRSATTRSLRSERPLPGHAGSSAARHALRPAPQRRRPSGDRVPALEPRPRQSWRRPEDGGFEPARYGIAPIAEAAAKTFVTRLHYSGTYPAASQRYGLFNLTRGMAELVGVAVLSVPSSRSVLTSVFPRLEPYAESRLNSSGSSSSTRFRPTGKVRAVALRATSHLKRRRFHGRRRRATGRRPQARRGCGPFDYRDA